MEHSPSWWNKRDVVPLISACIPIFFKTLCFWIVNKVSLIAQCGRSTMVSCICTPSCRTNYVWKHCAAVHTRDNVSGSRAERLRRWRAGCWMHSSSSLLSTEKTEGIWGIDSYPLFPYWKSGDERGIQRKKIGRVEEGRDKRLLRVLLLICTCLTLLLMFLSLTLLTVNASTIPPELKRLVTLSATSVQLYSEFSTPFPSWPGMQPTGAGNSQALGSLWRKWRYGGRAQSATADMQRYLAVTSCVCYRPRP